MSKVRFYAVIAVATWGVAACAGSGSSGSSATPAPNPEASSYSLEGFSVTRPSGWKFVEPDDSVASDTVILMYGPQSERVLLPTFTVQRRPLDASARRHNPTHILTTQMSEFAQNFVSMTVVQEPADTQLAGQDAGFIEVEFEEMLADGNSEHRRGRFYAVVKGGNIWIVHCVAADSSNVCDGVWSGISIDS